MNKPLPKIEDLFEDFAKMTGHDCCAEHKYAARKIFFCGFASSMRAHQDLADLPEMEGARGLNALGEEAAIFMLEMFRAATARQEAMARGEPIPPASKPFVPGRSHAAGNN